MAYGKVVSTLITRPILNGPGLTGLTRNRTVLPTPSPIVGLAKKSAFENEKRSGTG